MSTAEDGLRYGFGKNWADFIEKNFSEDAVTAAQNRLTEFLRVNSLAGRTFLDIGCGSGLHSLAAYRLGAERVISFDYDHDSVATTERLRRHAGKPANWTVGQGSVLDRPFLEALDKADVIYSWGVLHHTGDMWDAIRNAALPMKPDGIFYIALYSADAYVDPAAAYWLKIKRRYNLQGPIGKRLMEWWYVWKFHIVPTWKAGGNPLDLMRRSHDRGMIFWTDVRDWLGDIRWISPGCMKPGISARPSLISIWSIWRPVKATPSFCLLAWARTINGARSRSGANSYRWNSRSAGSMVPGSHATSRRSRIQQIATGRRADRA